MIRKTILLAAVLISLISQFSYGMLPCGRSSAGVLNVGIVAGNLPYSDVQDGNAIGFDPLLVQQVAKLMGFDVVNFVVYTSSSNAEADLNVGAIDIYANSSIGLTPLTPTQFTGIVTDISSVPVNAVPRGWLFSLACCYLAELTDAAITRVVDDGTYAQILQAVRLNGWTNGFTLGLPESAANPTGVLQEPAPFSSSEIGTIPAFCAPDGPNYIISLPEANYIAAFLQLINGPQVNVYEGL